MPRKSKLGEPNAFWKYGNKFYNDPWIDAIAAIDNDGGNVPLIEMLLSDATLDGVNRHHLADLLNRRNHNGDNAALVAMLLSDAQFGNTERRDLADLLNSKKLVPNVGQPPTPTYAESWAEAIIADAVAGVGRLVKQNKPKKRAIAEISELLSIDEGMLGRAVRRSTGSVRRAAERKEMARKKK
jgi:hypothetical protein